jgi:indoleamine 2,3-dioxygenase
VNAALGTLVVPNLSPSRGFLPLSDPLPRLPTAFDAWEEVAQALPKLLVTDQIRTILENLPPFPLDEIRTDAERDRAMLVLSFLGHAYVWGGDRAADRIPAVLAVPWHAIATRCGRPPVLSYSSYALHNWRRIDPARDVELGNIALLQNFLAGMDEEWFILIHVAIERQAAAAIAALPTAQACAEAGNAEELAACLGTVRDSLSEMVATMRRMPERCDPYIYYHRVRPFIHGWKNHPDLPEGVVYEGVAEYAGQPQRFRGETGAQSAIVPALDAALGVHHEEDVLKTYLLEMRTYHEPGQRAFIEALEAGPSVRSFVLSPDGFAARAAYDACVRLVEEFRSIHLEYAATYIHKQAQTDSKNPHEVGTGGTPFMRYLKKHRDETTAHTVGA